MRKTTYFLPLPLEGWPDPKDLEPYFLAPPGQQWTFSSGNDNWGLTAEGVDGTEGLEPFKYRVDIRLSMWGHPTLGVLLIYEKLGGGHNEAFTSKGDLTRLGELIRTLQGDLMPVGLFIPFREAWKAVKEFIETDGELPKGIEWVANKNLPPNTFPEP